MKKKGLKPIDIADGLFSQYIRRRDGVCMYGRDMNLQNECNGYLHASHVISKGACSELRYNPNNAITLCAKHHLYGWHSSNPAPYVDWFVKHYPLRWKHLNGIYAGYKLKQGTDKAFKPTKEYYKKIIDFYTKELEKDFSVEYS